MQTAPAVRAAEAPPSEMQSARRWLLWSREPRRKPDGSTHDAKVPKYTTGERRRGDLGNDADRLATYAEACAALTLWGDQMAGLGFALGDGWQGIDFDKTHERPALAALVDTLPGYVERSPSGNGWHAIGYGAPFAVLGSNASGIEAYCEGRFFTFTGDARAPGQCLADLGPFVSLVLAPQHGEGRRVREVPPGPVAVLSGEREVDELADALRYLDADDRDTWIRVGQALYTLGEKGLALWSAWSATSSRFPGGDDLERFETFSGTRTSWQSVFNQAAAAGWKNPRKLDPAAIFGALVVAAPGGRAANAPQLLGPVPVAIGSVPAPLGPMPVPPPALVRLEGQQHRETDGTQRAATIENLVDALGPVSGLRLSYDTFLDAPMICLDGRFRPYSDDDGLVLREQLGRSGFKPVSEALMRDAVQLVSIRNRFDGAVAWVNALEWDGVPRIDTAMSSYYGTEDTPYTRAVGAYLFTALAGRALVPGIQADMAIILVGMQGARKTSAVAALCPTPEAFVEVNLGKRDDDLARRLRGKLVVEWAEMRGLSGGRDLDGIKAWISRRSEQWTKKFKEHESKFDRRCIVIGTSNENELLDDPTGERRWLPVTSGRTNVEGIVRDRELLWAEGAARFRANGIEWQAAERLARDVHEQYKVSDSWADSIEAWLQAYPVARPGEMPSAHRNGELPIALRDVAVQALGLRIGDVRRGEELRIAKCLRKLSYEKRVCRSGKVLGKRWFPFVALSE